MLKYHSFFFFIIITFLLNRTFSKRFLRIFLPNYILENGTILIQGLNVKNCFSTSAYFLKSTRASVFALWLVCGKNTISISQIWFSRTFCTETYNSRNCFYFLVVFWNTLRSLRGEFGDWFFLFFFFCLEPNLIFRSLNTHHRHLLNVYHILSSKEKNNYRFPRVIFKRLLVFIAYNRRKTQIEWQPHMISRPYTNNMWLYKMVKSVMKLQFCRLG